MSLPVNYRRVMGKTGNNCGLHIVAFPEEKVYKDVSKPSFRRPTMTAASDSLTGVFRRGCEVKEKLVN